MSRRLRDSRVWGAGALASVLVTGSLLTATSAQAVQPESLIEDQQLAACINVVALKRDATTPLTHADTTKVTGSLTCNGNYAPIVSLTGLEQFPGLTALSFRQSLELHDLAPLGQLQKLHTLTIQNYLNSPAVIDLSPLGAAPLLRDLSLVPTGRPAAEVIGLGSLTRLTTLTVNAHSLPSLAGLESLTAMKDLRLANNRLGPGVLDQLGSHPLTNLFIRANAINDFRAAPSHGSLNASDQRVISAEPLVWSADETVLEASPAERTIGWAGATVTEQQEAAGGTLMFSREHDLSPAEELAGAFPGEVDLSYGHYASYDWSIAESGSRHASGRTFHPIISVDILDLPAMAATVGEDVQVAAGELATTGGQLSPDLGPVEYSVTRGTLPAGLSLDAATGELSGTPTTAGSFTFTVTARLADDQLVSGTHTLTVRDGLTDGNTGDGGLGEDQGAAGDPDGDMAENHDAKNPTPEATRPTAAESPQVLAHSGAAPVSAVATALLVTAAGAAALAAARRRA